MQPFTLLLAALQLGAGAQASPITVDNATNTSTAVSSLSKRAGFAFTCKDMGPQTPYYGDHFVANCADADNRRRKSWLNLNECLGNQGGDLVPQSGGNFGVSCDTRAAEFGAKFSYCLPCKRWGGEWQRTCINLDEILSNQNGELECFGHWAYYSTYDF
ncbi:Cyanovirin-N [Microdochium trichocladiopsis]|uniref:Cyanovirin-N n=1 Tax=Microdochium trichocladiopsis TaxID=1682393 RepID=A0A9P9BIZ1_9PEZI|nr:Cyanovirin-N [Microdochium trichocladiopsis]KAH7024743.1 Cyanovirin-N [Microdochium trichocladiopsis]